MKISNDVMKIVEEREREKQDLKRCLAVNVCPKCGDFLNVTCNEIMENYKCTSCSFEVRIYLEKKLQKFRQQYNGELT